jgi:hypothetical protein
MRHLKKINEEFPPSEYNDAEEVKQTIKNDYQERINLNKILPKMFRVSNNSVITNKTAIAIAKHFDVQEIREFETWLKIIDDEILLLKHQANKKRPW